MFYTHPQQGGVEGGDGYSNSQIMKNTKYYEMSTIYECIEKIIDDYCL